MLRHSHLAIAAILVVMFVLTACGGSKADDDITPSAPEPTSTAAIAPVSTAEVVTPAPTQAPPTAAPAPTPQQPAVPTPTAPAQTQPARSAPAPTATAPAKPVNGDSVTAADASLGQTEQYLPTVEVVKILTPSVVQVVTEVLAMGFFNQPVPSRGVGTGVILDKEGHILTNNHVVEGAQTITVTLGSGESFPAEIVGRDPTTDLAVIRIEAGAEELTPAKLGRSADAQVGEDVIAIGHALGLAGGPTVSKGVVSAVGRSIDTDRTTTIVDLIQTDASINPGNSGGPLANARAEVIGINTAIIQSGRGIGFAINIDDAKVVVAQLIDKGGVERGFLGISPVNVTPGLAEQLDLPVKTGILLARVIEGTAAEAAGLLEEDVIVEMNGEPIDNTGELSKFLIAHPPGETVDVTFYRGDTRRTTEVTLRARPDG